jgi:SulP family sulfate permease
VGRLGSSQHFRNYLRHPVEQTEGVLVFRMDEGLTFINASFLESYVIDQVERRKDIHSVVLVASGINDIDSTGIDRLKEINQFLLSRRINFYLSDVKGPILDRLRWMGLEEDFLDRKIFLSADEAVKQLTRLNGSGLEESAQDLQSTSAQEHQT